MKIFNILLVTILVLSAPSEVRAVESSVDQSPPQVQAEVQQVDVRIEKLKQFFQKNNCTQPYHIPTYLAMADKFDLPYTLLPVISLKESTCGKFVFRRNNWWGFGSESYNTVDEGIWRIGGKLSQGQYYKGKTLEQKLRTYNSVNKDYPRHAIGLMQGIEN